MGWKEKFDQMKKDVVDDLRKEVGGGIPASIPNDLEKKVKEDLQEWFEEQTKEMLDDVKRTLEPAVAKIDEKIAGINNYKREIEEISADRIDRITRGIEATEGEVNKGLIRIGSKVQEIQREIEGKKTEVKEEIEKGIEGVRSRLSDTISEGAENALKDFISKNAWKIVGWLIMALFGKGQKLLSASEEEKK